MSIQDSTSTIKVDVYQKVTDAIVNAIEQGVGAWRMPWHTSGRYAFSPINVTSKKCIGGQHVFVGSASPRGMRSGEWGIYKTIGRNVADRFGRVKKSTT